MNVRLVQTIAISLSKSATIFLEVLTALASPIYSELELTVLVS